MNQNQNKNKQRKNRFFEYLTEKAELPADLLAGEFRIELRGRNTVFLHGCRRILKYSQNEMIMAAKGFSVSIRGDRLVCSAYHDGTVSIDGYICGVEFDPAEKRGEEKE